MVFSGSDWCAPCIKLDKLVWQTKEFTNYADKNLVLYKADFPRKKKNQLSEELTIANKQLAEKYKLQSFPSVFLLSANGKILDVLTNVKQNPKSYLAKLNHYIE